MNRQKNRACPSGPRGVIARMAFIKAAILRGPIGERKVNARQLARLWECAEKTIHRDIEFMRDRLGHQIAFDAATGNYRYEQPPETVL